MSGTPKNGCIRHKRSRFREDYSKYTDAHTINRILINRYIVIKLDLRNDAINRLDQRTKISMLTNTRLYRKLSPVKIQY